jgi:hypothetical protein
MPKKWSDFYNDLVPSLPGVGLPLLEHELRRAAQDFFSGSRAWRIVLDPIGTEAGVFEYQMMADDRGQDVVRIEAAAYLSGGLDVLTLPDVVTRYGADWWNASGSPAAVTQLRPGYISLCPTPDAAVADALVLTVSVRPSDTSTGIDDDLAIKFRSALIDGAKGRLMLMPKKPWTDFQLGSVLSARFGDKVDDARSKAERAYGRGRVRSRPQWC